VGLLSRALAALLMLPLRFYRLALSPLLPRMCRFHPSCSVYAMGALAVHGPFKGTWLAAKRVASCHPFHHGGLDPVPPLGGAQAHEVIGARSPWLAKQLTAPPPPEVLVLEAERPHLPSER
jgi:putative membrane protein insertion efficiency factor